MGPLAVMAIIQAGATIIKGFQARSAANSEADRLREQANIALQESRRDAEQQAREITSFQSSQAHTYASSGITLEGSPVVVLEQTRKLGQQQVDAVIRRGMAQSNLINQQADAQRKAGRNALIGAFVSAAAGGANTYMKGQSIGTFGNQQVALQTPTATPVIAP